MKSVIFWFAFLLLLPQALYVRRTATRSAPADGPDEDAVGDGPSLRLLAIGDSIVAGVGATTLDRALVGQTAAAIAASLSSRVAWQALGVSGYDVAKVRRLLIPQLSPTSFDFIVVSVGVNDITGLTRLSTWEKSLCALFQELRAQSPDATIAMTGMPPMHAFPLLPQPLRAVIGMRARMVDRVAKAVAARQKNVMHVSLDFDLDPAKFAADGYHPSEESYVEFGETVARALLRAR